MRGKGRTGLSISENVGANTDVVWAKCWMLVRNCCFVSVFEIYLIGAFGRSKKSL